LSSLPKLVQQETAALRSFISLLEQESKLLVADNVDQLLLLAEEKSAYAANLSEIGNQRESAFSQLGVQTNAPAISERLQNQPESLRRAWQSLIELAREARELNSLNGKLINTRLQHNQQALNVLLDAAAPVNTYGPDGQQRMGSGSGRTFGSA
jgi:flagellar biosynthesis protein FlgN